ncbi:MAG: carbonic anhydrase [Proteobacteria bacterium]|nr:carbonic anhydrase [Pseudomonadota bacterium]
MLDHLFDRNLAWVQKKRLDDPDFFRRMGEQQSPNYLWIGCSDSRVTANDVLGLDPGEIFVHRNIANVVHTSDMNILAVLEYAVVHLKVEHIIVCGHYGCGGVERALSGESTALVDHWLQPIVMLYRKHRTVLDAIADRRARLDRMCEINIELQVRRLASTPIVEQAWLRGQELHLHGWIYGIHDGLIRALGAPVSSLDARDTLASIDARIVEPVEPVSVIRQHAIAAFEGLDSLEPPEGLDCCAEHSNRRPAP